MSAPTPAAPAPRRRNRIARLVAVVVAAAAALALIGWAVDTGVSGPGTYQVKAVFAAAPGIYPGNAVTVLGVRVGSVASVDPGPNGVTIAMDIDDGTTLPADVKAYLMAPNVVNDRFLELDPAYTGGPRLAHGATLPLSRTVVPLSVDQIIKSVNELSVELGPEAGNKNGALSRLLHAVATSFGGNGASLNASIKGMGDAFAAISAHTDDLTSLLNNLGGLTHTAAGISGLYEQFAGDLAQVSSTFADDHAAIGQVLHNLGDVLTQLNTFVRNNRKQLAGTLNSLSRVAKTVGDRQQALAKTLGILPLAAANVNKTVDGDHQIRTRLDVPKDSAQLNQQVCGNAVLRLLLVSLDQSEDKIPAMDLACGADSLLSSFATSPGSPSAKQFTLEGLLSMEGSS